MKFVQPLDCPEPKLPGKSTAYMYSSLHKKDIEDPKHVCSVALEAKCGKKGAALIVGLSEGGMKRANELFPFWPECQDRNKPYLGFLPPAGPHDACTRTWIEFAHENFRTLYMPGHVSCFSRTGDDDERPAKRARLHQLEDARSFSGLQ